MIGKFASYFGIFFISLGAAGLIVSLVTSKWVSVTISVSGKKIATETVSINPGNKGSSGSNDIGTLSPMLYSREFLKKMSVDTEMHFGLKQMCTGHTRINPELLKIEKMREAKRRSIPGLCFDIDMYEQYEGLMDEATKDSRPWKFYKKIVSALHNTMICLAIASALGIIALILSFVKLPACHVKSNTVLVWVTMVVCGLAVLASVIGIVLFHNNVQIKNEVDDMIYNYAARASTEKPSVLDIMKKMFDLKEKSGYSRYMAYAGPTCFFLAVLMNVLELVFRKSTTTNDYKMELIQNGEYA